MVKSLSKVGPEAKVKAKKDSEKGGGKTAYHQKAAASVATTTDAIVSDEGEESEEKQKECGGKFASNKKTDLSTLNFLHRHRPSKTRRGVIQVKPSARPAPPHPSLPKHHPQPLLPLNHFPQQLKMLRTREQSPQPSPQARVILRQSCRS